MALDSAFYLVSEDIARRCGLIGQRYHVGNRYVLDNKDLGRIRLTSEEFLNGLQGIEMISADEAKRLIVQSGYNMGGTANYVASQAVETEEPIVEEPAPETIEEPANDEEPAEETTETGNENNNEPKEEEE